MTHSIDGYDVFACVYRIKMASISLQTNSIQQTAQQQRQHLYFHTYPWYEPAQYKV